MSFTIKIVYTKKYNNLIIKRFGSVIENYNWFGEKLKLTLMNEKFYFVNAFFLETVVSNMNLSFLA